MDSGPDALTNTGSTQQEVPRSLPPRSMSFRTTWVKALIEGGAVLAGILIAFGIDAGWDIRSERERERSYLVAVREELEGNRMLFQQDIIQLETWIKASYEHLTNIAASRVAAADRNEILEMAWLTGPDRTSPPARAALDDLVSSGGFQILRSSELRRNLADYQRALERDREQHQVIREYFYRDVQPYHISHGSFVDFPMGERFGLDVADADFEVDPARFVSNRTYANLLVVRILEFRNLQGTHRDVLARIETVLTILERSID